jgi:hypothetical protein
MKYFVCKATKKLGDNVKQLKLHETFLTETETKRVINKFFTNKKKLQQYE